MTGAIPEQHLLWYEMRKRTFFGWNWLLTRDLVIVRGQAGVGVSQGGRF
jgi:hypothetical protein